VKGGLGQGERVRWGDSPVARGEYGGAIGPTSRSLKGNTGAELGSTEYVGARRPVGKKKLSQDLEESQEGDEF